MKMLVRAAALSICAVFSAAGSERWNQAAGGEWIPTYSELQALQVGLEQYVHDQAKLHGWKLADWDTYKFQYQGQTKDNRQFVFVSAFCYLDDQVDLREGIVVVLDGGNCYFTIKFDPAHNEFFDFVLNGEA